MIDRLVWLDEWSKKHKFARAMAVLFAIVAPIYTAGAFLYPHVTAYFCTGYQQECIQSTLAHQEAQFSRGLDLIVAGEDAEAVAVFRSIVDGKRRAPHPYAAAHLALSYSTGIGVDPDPDRARQYARDAMRFRLAELSEARHPRALHLLGRFHEEGLHVPQDEEKAIELMRQAARQGEHFAALDLAAIYDARDDIPQTIEWTRLPAIRNFPLAAEAYGRLLQRGLIRNDSHRGEVRQHLIIAAEAEHNASAVLLGDLLAGGFFGILNAERLAEAAGHYRGAASRGYALAQYRLANALRDGMGVQPDDTEAVRWYAQAAAKGLAEAQNDLAWMYQRGRGVPQDEARAAGLYRQAAEQGLAVAQNNLGLSTELGQGVEASDAEAARWYASAAAQGHANAQANIGWMYEMGRGVERNDTTAVFWYMQAAVRGLPRGQYNLGGMIAEGRGTARDPVEANRWFRLAAEQGYSHAQNSLGWSYQTARGLERNDAQAVEWYRKAAEQGLALAQENLAGMLRDGLGIAQDDAQAARLFQLSVEQGSTAALVELGWMYERGRGVPRDQSRAVALYRAAAERGYAIGQDYLGVMLLNGYGIEQDDDEAFLWFQRAAAQGQANALRNLGWCYEVGRGVVKDQARAVELYRLAAEQGLPRGQESLAIMLAAGAGTPRDVAAALAWHHRAAEQGHAPSQVALGWMYLNGQGTEQNHPEALTWFRRAVAQDSASGRVGEGWMAENGLAMEKDYTAARRLYGQAAEAGHSGAQYHLARLLYYPTFSFSLTDEATAMARASREQENICGAYVLAEILLNSGRTDPVTAGEVLSALNLAADGSHSCAQNTLGNLYEFGYLVEADYLRASEFYRQASENGNAQGATNFYRLGRQHHLINDGNHAVYLRALERAVGQRDRVALCMLINEHLHGLRRNIAMVGKLIEENRDLHGIAVNSPQELSIFEQKQPANFENIVAPRYDLAILPELVGNRAMAATQMPPPATAEPTAMSVGE
ncbi:hypothetical protein [Roseococcus sp. YIM B11640]|uniref:tetratricopeptide repeat protein n=1 Tax=Roseococcus sp. YIM B11640 TaxID=3133973 RepID=UPI003C798CD5